MEAVTDSSSAPGAAVPRRDQQHEHDERGVEGLGAVRQDRDNESEICLSRRYTH